MSSAELPRFVTADDYLAAEELAFGKSELVDGWMRAMTGATIRYNCVKMNCLVSLAISLKGHRCRPFDSNMKLRVRQSGATRFYYADLQVVCDSNPPISVYQDSPVLIIKVLSPSTRRYDLDEKMNASLQIPSLQCYVILEQRSTDRHRDAAQRRWFPETANRGDRSSGCPAVSRPRDGDARHL